MWEKCKTSHVGSIHCMEEALSGCVCVDVLPEPSFNSSPIYIKMFIVNSVAESEWSQLNGLIIIGRGKW